MPHKHKRKHGQTIGDDKDAFDLPPEKRAKPLSVHKAKPETWEGFDGETKGKKGASGSDKLNKRRKASRGQGEDGKKSKDDTPKNFARLMAWQREGRKLRKGLDDGEGRNKRERGGKAKGMEDKGTGKRKKSNTMDAMAESVGGLMRTEGLPSTKAMDVDTTTTVPEPQPQNEEEKLKIKPGERLSDFAVRVDQSLPLSNVPKHGTKDTVLGLKQKLTKHNRNLQRMQTEWRNAENKIKSRREEEDDELADQKEENQLLWMDVNLANTNRKGKKKRKVGNLDEADPWKALEKKRKEAGDRGAVAGLRASDTVQAPPTLKPLKNMFKQASERKTTTAVKVS